MAKHSKTPDIAESHNAPAEPSIHEKAHRKRRTRLIVIVVILALVVAGLGGFVVYLVLQSNTTAAKTAQTAGTDQTIAKTASETVEAEELTTVPNMTALIGMTYDEAVESLGHGAEVTKREETKEAGATYKAEVTIELAGDHQDSLAGKPVVELKIDWSDKVIEAEYAGGITDLGYGTVGFAEVVETKRLFQHVMEDMGLAISDDDVVLPPASQYAEYEDGKLVEEELTCSGTAEADGKSYHWEATLCYDYGDTGGDLTKTVRTFSAEITAA